MLARNVTVATEVYTGRGAPATLVCPPPRQSSKADWDASLSSSRGDQDRTAHSRSQEDKDLTTGGCRESHGGREVGVKKVYVPAIFRAEGGGETASEVVSRSQASLDAAATSRARADAGSESLVSALRGSVPTSGAGEGGGREVGASGSIQHRGVGGGKQEAGASTHQDSFCVVLLHYHVPSARTIVARC